VPFLPKKPRPIPANCRSTPDKTSPGRTQDRKPPVNCYKSIGSHQKFLTSAGCPLGKTLIYQNLQIERTKNPLSVLGFFNICLEKSPKVQKEYLPKPHSPTAITFVLFFSIRFFKSDKYCSGLLCSNSPQRVG